MARETGAMLARDGQTKSRSWLWMLSAFCAAVASAGLVVTILGAGEKGAAAALKVSALFSFLLFFAAYSGSPLAAIFGRLFDGLSRRGRDFGLAFAAALIVHLSLAVLTIERSTHPFVPGSLTVAEIIGALWIYSIAVFSIARLRLMISAVVWRRMRALGMDYVALIFARNFLMKPLYVPFLLLTLGAIMLRVAASTRGRPNKSGNDLAQDDSSSCAG